jgi:hypothetical protein
MFKFGKIFQYSEVVKMAKMRAVDAAMYVLEKEAKKVPLKRAGWIGDQSAWGLRPSAVLIFLAVSLTLNPRPTDRRSNPLS